jgi:hypothetical protein
MTGEMWKGEIEGQEVIGIREGMKEGTEMKGGGKFEY